MESLYYENNLSLPEPEEEPKTFIKGCICNKIIIPCKVHPNSESHLKEYINTQQISNCSVVAIDCL